MALDSNDFQDLVGQFVRDSIRRPLDALGVRRTDVTFTDTQEAAAGVFLLYAQTPFYVLYLAAQRLLEQVASQAEILDELQRLISATGRLVQPIKDLTPLSNITSALFELERAIGQRQDAFKNIEEVPAFKRFNENVQRFLESSGRNVKEGGAIVETPQQARSLIPDLIKLLQQSQEELVRRATLIEGGLADYANVNLPALAASGVISRSRAVIQARSDSMSPLSPTDRLLENKDAVLELIASRAIVRQFSSFAKPNSIFGGNITATAYADADFPSSSAYIEADFTYYYPRDGYNVLDFYVDSPLVAKYAGLADLSVVGVYRLGITQIGAFGTIQVGDVVYIRSGSLLDTRWVVYSSTNDVLLCSGAVDPVIAAGISIEIYRAPDESVQTINGIAAFIDGLAPEPWSFRDNTGDDPQNYRFDFSFNGQTYSSQVVAGTHAVTWSAYGFSDPISTVEFLRILNFQMDGCAPPHTIRFEPYFYPPRYDAEVVVTLTGLGIYEAAVLSGDLDSLNIQTVGWYLRFVSGPNKGLIYNITDVGVSPAQFVEFQTPTVGEVTLGNHRVQLGTKPKIRMYRTDTLASMQDRIPFKLLLDDPPAIVENAFPMIGMTQGRTSNAGPIKARKIAEDINGKGTKVGASLRFEPAAGIASSLARTDPLAPTRITLYKLRGVGDVVAAGLTIVLTVDGDSVDTSSLEVNDVVVLRTGNPVDSVFLVTAWTGTTISATGLVGATTQSEVEYEIGSKDLPTDDFMTVYVDEGPNSGTYDVTGLGNTPLDFYLTPQLPLRQDAKRDPLFMTARIGTDILQLRSTTALTTSSVVVAGSAASQYFTAFPSDQGGGTTPYLLLDAIPAGLQIGDYLEYYETDYATPSEVYTIEEINVAASVIKLDREVASGLVINISQETVPPFGLLRVKQVLSTTGLETKIKTWRERASNLPSYFIDLNRFINPVLVNDNPTAVQVTDAINKVRELYKYLTEAAATEYGGVVADTLENILSSYSVEHQPAVDTLIKSFREKGADRAVDILLEGSFTGFFGLDADGSSYAGDMLAKVREVAREDLPIRGTDRLAAQQGQLLASTEEEDFETSGSDTDVPRTPTG